jgi:hypothetical protein
MSSRRVSPIARARSGKAESNSSTTVSAASSTGKRASPIARAREDAKKGERRKSAERSGQKVSPIARARESKAAAKKTEVVQKSLDVVEDDDDDFPPLSVPFGLECYLTHTEIRAANDYIDRAFPKKNDATSKFQIYTVDYDEDTAQNDLSKEYESVLVFHWFRPAVGVNIKDITDVWETKKGKWHGLLRVAGLMPKDKVLKDIEFPEMLDPVEEEDGEEEEESK